MQSAVEAWAEQHPEAVAALNEVSDIAAVAASQRGAMGAQALGQEVRFGADVDLRTLDFDGAAKRLVAQVEDPQDLETITGDGLTMTLYARRATVAAGADLIEFLQPLGPVRIGNDRYPAGLTRAEFDAAPVYRTRQGNVRVDDLGTLRIYSERQGAPPSKLDEYRAALTLATTPEACYSAFIAVLNNRRNNRISSFNRRVAILAMQLLRSYGESS